MPKTVSRELQEKYDDYYGEQELEEWRQVGANRKASNIIALASEVPHESIIDVGAGEGSVAAQLSQSGFGERITCAEISSSGIAEIERKDIPAVTETMEFDGYDLPANDDEYDLAIASHVLEHVEYQREFLEELKRVGRFVYLEVPLEDRLTMPSDYQDNEEGHINFYNYKTFRRLLQSSGFEVLNQEIFGHSIRALEMQYGTPRAYIYYTLLEGGLKISKRHSSLILPYHCGAICRTS